MCKMDHVLAPRTIKQSDNRLAKLNVPVRRYSSLQAQR